MGERKVLNKYYPIDFETYKLPKLKLPKDRQYVVRLMSPFTMRCLTCGEYIYHGRKFNARKETVQNEDYLGIPIHRFYIRCTRCLSEITFKTDPKNTDYVAEHGAVRTFQAHRVLEKQEEERKREKEEQEANDPMLALENRTRDSRREMDVLDALEDIKDQNARFEQVDLNALLKKYEEEERRQLQRQEEEDEALVESIFRKSDGVKRLQDDGGEDDHISERKLNTRTGTKRPPTDVLVGEGGQDSGSSNVGMKKGKTSKGALLGIVKRTNKSKSGSLKVGEDRLGEDAPTEEDKVKDSVKVGDISTPQSCDGRIEDKDKGSNSGLGLIGAYSDTDSDST